MGHSISVTVISSDSKGSNIGDNYNGVNDDSDEYDCRCGDCNEINGTSSGGDDEEVAAGVDMLPWFYGSALFHF